MHVYIYIIVFDKHCRENVNLVSEEVVNRCSRYGPALKKKKSRIKSKAEIIMPYLRCLTFCQIFFTLKMKEHL